MEVGPRRSLCDLAMLAVHSRSQRSQVVRACTEHLEPEHAAAAGASVTTADNQKMTNALLRSEPCPECGAEMLWTQNAWRSGDEARESLPMHQRPRD